MISNHDYLTSFRVGQGNTHCDSKKLIFLFDANFRKQEGGSRFGHPALQRVLGEARVKGVLWDVRSALKDRFGSGFQRGLLGQAWPLLSRSPGPEPPPSARS